MVLDLTYKFLPNKSPFVQMPFFVILCEYLARDFLAYSPFLPKFLSFARNLPFSQNRHLSRFPCLSPHLSFCQTFDGFLPNSPFSQFTNFVKSLTVNIAGLHSPSRRPCWCSRKKSISLLWELNSIFVLILGEKYYCIDPPHGSLVTWLQTKKASFVVSFKIFARSLMNPNSPISKNLSFS